MTRCSYGDCKSDSKRNKKIKFIPFPKKGKGLKRCLKWLELCGNKKLTADNITRNTYVCNKHFTVPITKSSDPIPYSASLDSPADEVPINCDENFQHAELTHEEDLIHDPDSPEVQMECDEFLQHEGSSSDEVLIPECPHEEELLCEKSTQAGSEARKENKLSFENLSKIDKHFKFFTGLKVMQFEALYEFLDPEVMGNLKYPFKNYQRSGVKKWFKEQNMTYKDKLCVTLVRLRRGFTLDELAFFCNQSKTLISVVFYTWIQFMYYQIIGIRGDMFRSSRNLKKIPYCFRHFDDHITVVIDGTEIFLQMPSNFMQQGNTFSSYKHSNTVKFLVGISQSGAIIYASEGFEGAISDRELYEKSDLKYFLQENDAVMADRGFTIQDKLDEINVKFYTPPLLMKRKRLTPQEEILTKRIAKSRVHVERAIRKIKTFKILSKRCPILLLPILSSMFSVVCFLVNFDDCLVT